MGEELLVQFQDVGVDAAESERLTQALRRELLDIPEVDQVDQRTAGPAPPGARAVDLVELGSLLVSMKPTIEGLGKIVGVLRGWLASLRRAGGSRATLRITVNGHSLELTPTTDEQHELVKEFIRASAAGH